MAADPSVEAEGEASEPVAELEEGEGETGKGEA
jgi:hypothetical protein